MRGFKRNRKTAKLRQDDVAKALGLSSNTISMWETGRALPRADMLTKIADLYGCTVDDLLRDDTDTEDAVDAAPTQEIEIAEVKKCQY